MFLNFVFILFVVSFAPCLSSQVDRYVEIILSIIRQTPELLYMKFHNHRDAHSGAQLFVCDHIKCLPDSKYFKYRLLAALINISDVHNAIHNTLFKDSMTAVRSSTKDKDKTGDVKRAFVLYHGEEELIIRAVSYGFAATDEDLAHKLCNFDKRIPVNGVEGTLLHAVARVSQLDAANKMLHRENLITFRLIVEAVKVRVNNELLDSEAADTYFYSVEDASGETFHSLISSSGVAPSAPAVGGGDGGEGEGSTVDQEGGGGNYLVKELLSLWGPGNQ